MMAFQIKLLPNKHQTVKTGLFGQLCLRNVALAFMPIGLFACTYESDFHGTEFRGVSCLGIFTKNLMTCSDFG